MAARPSTQAAGPLSSERIVDAAVTLIERDGPGALTMRRVGAELGVEAMSLYHHIANRDALLAAIAERLLAPLADVCLTNDPAEACASFARAMRGVAVTHPATFRLVALRPLDTPASLVAVERLLGILVDAGLPPAGALAAYRAVASYARGYALAEATGFTVDAATTHGRQALSVLPAEDFPILAGRTGELTHLDADQAFESGLRALVSGLVA